MGKKVDIRPEQIRMVGKRKVPRVKLRESTITLQVKEGAAVKPMEVSTSIAKQMMLEALQDTLGVRQAAMDQIGLNRSTFYDWVANDPAFVAAMDHLTDLRLDYAEHQLNMAMGKLDTKAITYFLDAHGKKRGYGQIPTFGNQGTIIVLPASHGYPGLMPPPPHLLSATDATPSAAGSADRPDE